MTPTASIHLRTVMRRLLVPAILAGALVAGALPGTVLATWTSDKITDGFRLSRPAVRIDANGKTGIAYERVGSAPGIFFATDATGSWVTTRVASGSLRTPDLAFDAANKAHIVFADLGSKPGIYEATNASGSWAVTKLADDSSPWAPSIAIDISGKQHIAYSSVFSFQPGLSYLTDATGSWVNRHLTTGMYDQEPSLAIDGAGKVRIAFARYLAESHGIYLMTNATGSWVSSRISNGSDDYPALEIDPAGKDRVGFTRSGNSPGLWYADDVAGPWASAQVFAGKAGIPALGLQSGGTVQLIVRAYTGDPMSEGLYQFSGGGLGGGWTTTIFADGNNEFPSLAIGSDDQLRVAWGAEGWSSGVVYMAPPDTGLVVDTENVDTSPSLAVDGNGRRHLGFFRSSDASGGTTYGTEAAGDWAFEHVSGDAPPPDLAVDASGKAHLVAENHYATNATGSWVSTLLPSPQASHPALAVDASGKAFVAYQVTDTIVSPVPGIHYATDATGTWVDTRLTTAAGDSHPDIAVDGNGKAHVVYERSSRIWYRTNRSGSWSAPVQLASIASHDPVIALDPVGKVHVAFRGEAGVYEVNNVSGSWTLTRLSRSYADGAPSLGIDANAKVYVLFDRASWAANPGIYLATNRTGSYVLGLSSSLSHVGGMSMVVLPAGLAHVVIDGPNGLMSLDQIDFLASSIGTSGGSRASIQNALDGSGQDRATWLDGLNGVGTDPAGGSRIRPSESSSAGSRTRTGGGGGSH